MDIGLVGLGKMGGNMREPSAPRRSHRRRLRPQPRRQRRRLASRTGRAAAHAQGRLGDGPRRRPDPRRPSPSSGTCSARATWSSTAATRAGPTTRPTPSCSPSKGIGFVDCGVSGGVWGLENGYALMYGGSADDIAKVQPAFDTLKPEGEFGSVHAGKVGAGHFSKMVHNGIEYAIMQAYAEGWELLEKVDLVDNVTEVFRSWREGTVIRSWLLDLLVAALDEDPGLDKIRGYADDSGEGRWTVEAGIENAVATPAITAALYARFVSRQDDSPAMKAVAAMRNQFGGHAVHDRAASGRGRRPDGQATAGRVRLPPLPARLPSYADVEVSSAGRHGVRRPQRAGQDQPGRGDRLPLPARLAPGRHDAPLVRAGRRAGDRARGGGRATAARRCSRSRSTRAGPTGRGSTSRRCRGPAT